MNFLNCCFKRAYGVNIMAAIIHNEHSDFHWTAPELFISILVAVAATLGLWFFSGLLIMLFLL